MIQHHKVWGLLVNYNIFIMIYAGSNVCERDVRLMYCVDSEWGIEDCTSKVHCWDTNEGMEDCTCILYCQNSRACWLGYSPFTCCMKFHTTCKFLVLYTCDVICKNLPYGGTNSVLLDQLFLHICDNIYCWNCSESDKNVCCRCWTGTNIVGPDQSSRITRGVWPGPTIFVPP